MVRTRLPKSLIALHPLIADQYILHGVIQSVAHVKLSRNIGRRHYNGKGLFILIGLCTKILLIQPFLIKFSFNSRRIIGFFQFFHDYLLPTDRPILPRAYIFLLMVAVKQRRLRRALFDS